MAKNESISTPFTELGGTGLRQWSGYVREEFLRDLTGWRGIRMFREMRDNDPVIGAIFFAIERLLLGVDFTSEPASSAPEDIEAADFVSSCLGDMEESWQEFMSEMLTFMQFGWAVHEICYKRRLGVSSDPIKNSKYDDGMIGWRKFAGRAQETLLHWEFDESGDATALIQLLPTGSPLLRVPLSKCLHFKTRLLKGNPEGVSLLRNAYVPYYRKKRIEEIEAIGIERDLAGLPIAWVPPRILDPNATEADKAQFAAVKQMVRDTVRNEQEGFVYPLAYYPGTNNKMYDFTLLSTGGRRQFDTTQIVDRYDQRICITMMAEFIVLGSGTSAASGRGSTGQTRSKIDLFKTALMSFLDMICEKFNRKAIPDLLTLNQMEGQCTMRHGDIEERDIAAFGKALVDAFSSGNLTPDSRTEAKVREVIGLPPLPGQNMDTLDTGGDAKGGSDDDPAATSSSQPARAQARGQDGSASDGGPAPGEPAVKGSSPRRRFQKRKK